MSRPDEGFHDGKIVAGYADQKSDGTIQACFDVNVEGGGAVTARHDCEGPYADKTPGVFETLGLPWPKGVRMLAETVGQRVRVHIKHKGEYVNAKIVRRRRDDDPSVQAAVDQFLARAEKPAADPNTAFDAAVSEDDLVF